MELEGALAAVLGESTLHEAKDLIFFRDALNYTGSADMTVANIFSYNQAMQYVTIADHVPRQALIEAIDRCSLAHALYEVVAEGETYNEIYEETVRNGGLDDLKRGQANGDATWCLRARQYGEISGSEKEKRSGARARSITLEREVLQALEPLLLEFGGKVHLDQPDCKIYAFDGLSCSQKVLARQIAAGPRTSIINPNTRICITNTPLCPLAAFSLCNVAGIRAGSTILDPYAGSCAVFLAAAMIEPTCKTVGIEISHNGDVNRDDIRKDFSTRDLVEPVALLKGDCTNVTMRDSARSYIGNEAFDMIITDPPYGIRECKSYNELSPIEELFQSIKNDRDAGKRLLKKGGRLVVFVPVNEEETLEGVLPSPEEMEEAGLRCEVVREQPLNEKLSRWLVSFLCIA